MIVVLRQQSDASQSKAQEIIQWMLTHTANYKKLRGGIVFVDAIPKKSARRVFRMYESDMRLSASGKIMRRSLKERQGDSPLGADHRGAKL